MTEAGRALGDRKMDLKCNGATPKIEIDAETYAVTADGELLVCEPAETLPMAQRYFCSEGRRSESSFQTCQTTSNR